MNFPQARLTPSRFTPTRRAVLFTLLWLTCGVAPCVAASQDLQAHGSDDFIWLARTQPDSVKRDVEITTLFLRKKSDSLWLRLEPVSSRIISMASRGSQLAILLANGDWKLTTESGLTSGRPLPGGARLVAISSDSTTLWGLAIMPAKGAGPTTAATTAPATRPSTTRATMSSAPSSQPTSGPLVLFRLGGQGWDEQGRLPENVIGGEPGTVALGVADGTPIVAHRVNDRTLNLYRRGGDRELQKFDEVTSNVDLQDFKLLGGTTGPVLWHRGATGPSKLRIVPHFGEPAVERELKVPANAEHTVTYGNGAIRLLWLDGEKIYDQRLKSDTGLFEGDPVPLTLPPLSIMPAVSFWAQLILTSALVFAFAASLRRRREMQEIELDPAKLRLAPFGLRFLAGTIDAIPLFAVTGMVWTRSMNTPDLSVLVTLAIGAGVYIALTTLVEMAVGRSIGKVCTGLYVVGLDGKPAPLGARVMRNLLRIIDLPIMPLTLVLFSPLRQRAADLAAGTLVIRGKVATADAPEKEESVTKKDADAS